LGVERCIAVVVGEVEAGHDGGESWYLSSVEPVRQRTRNLFVFGCRYHQQITTLLGPLQVSSKAMVVFLCVR
jgi:hypothetical protein